MNQDITETSISKTVSLLKRDADSLKESVLKRFLSYVQVYTSSDKDNPSIPSTQRQFDLARIIVGELRDLGITDVELKDSCYVLARIPASSGYEHRPVICYMAHMDTSPDAPGENVRPRLWENYQGGNIQISPEVALSVEENPLLESYIGGTIITSSGDTLLGADDKAGAAEIIAGIEFLLQHPEIPRPPIELLFTPDEEIGRGLDGFSRDWLQCEAAYTFDGGEEGELEAECYNGYMVEIRCQGSVIHPGYARGRLVNAVSMAASFIAMLPRNESPEATDERYGYYLPAEVSGDMDSARIEVNLRDFEISEIDRRIHALKAFAAAVEAQYPGGRVEVLVNKQYLNMRDTIVKYPDVMEFAREAIVDSGAQLLERSIRGGTDGARLCELGVPCPNIFAGGINFHSVREWIPLAALERAAAVAVTLACRWAIGSIAVDARNPG